jgi:hypothetical protein
VLSPRRAERDSGSAISVGYVMADRPAGIRPTKLRSPRGKAKRILLIRCGGIFPPYMSYVSARCGLPASPVVWRVLNERQRTHFCGLSHLAPGQDIHIAAPLGFVSAVDQ